MKFLKSPMNYIGGKYKLLSDIIGIFPEKIDTFVDLFAGGFNVGINVEADKIVCNDHIRYIIEIYNKFKNIPTEEILEFIYGRIKEFNLSKTNVEGYNKFRKYYNESKNTIDLFVLTCYSFNHQIRFNNKHEFNTPFGKSRSCYNDKIEKNLVEFCEVLKTKNIVFSNLDFLEVDTSYLTSDSLVYCDPPYLISNGSYNDGKRGFKNWTEKEEIELLEFLNVLNDRKIKFALSNVLSHKGNSNELLIDWSSRYNIIRLEMNYSNSNYQIKDRTMKTEEVIITNYEVVHEGKYL